MNPAVQTSWFDRVAERLQALAERPGLLFVLLLTANTLARPYAGFVHDARMYSVQVLNQVEPGSFGSDLFLRFGSQDQFSLFSRLVAPLAAIFGLAPTFFVLYVLFNSLLIWGLQRLVLALMPDRPLAVLSLFYLMIAPLSFGGFAIFQVHEPFLTPRIVANALVLFGLERLLHRRYVVAALLLFAGATQHPLMAQGGLLILACVLAWDLLPRWCFYTLVSLAGLAMLATVAIVPLGGRLYGLMDADWRDIVYIATTYNYPTEWGPYDWLNVMVAISTVGLAAYLWRNSDPDRSRILGLAAFIAVAGLAGTFIASFSPYALLFQVQPYRALWILKVLQVPAGFWLIARFWRFDRVMTRLTAALLVMFFFMLSDEPLELCFPLFFFPILALGYRGLEATPRHADWLKRTALMSLVLASIGWGLYKVAVLIANLDELTALLDGVQIFRLLHSHFGIMLWLVVALAIAGFVLKTETTLTRSVSEVSPSLTLRVGVTSQTLRAAAVLVVAFILPLALILLPQLPVYRENATVYRADLDRVGQFLRQQQKPGEPKPTMYCSIGAIEFLWVELRVPSYFDWAQMAGCMFTRKNAEEGQRRALVVRAFEIERSRKSLLLVPESRRRHLERFFQADLETLTPTRADLQRLAQDENVDYALLPTLYPDLVTFQAGNLYLYDCREIRRRSQETGVRRQETGVRSQESGVRSPNSILTPDSCLLTPLALSPPVTLTSEENRP